MEPLIQCTDTVLAHRPVGHNNADIR